MRDAAAISEFRAYSFVIPDVACAEPYGPLCVFAATRVAAVLQRSTNHGTLSVYLRGSWPQIAANWMHTGRGTSAFAPVGISFPVSPSTVNVTTLPVP